MTRKVDPDFWFDVAMWFTCFAILAAGMSPLFFI